MTTQLKEYLTKYNIKIVGKILDKREGSKTVGYHLTTPSIHTHEIDLENLNFFIKEFKQPYYTTDGYNFKDGKHDIFLHDV